MASVLSRIRKNHIVPRLLCLLVSTFLLTFVYNLFFVPNKIVIGGISGLAILIQELFHIGTSAFINISNFILIALSMIVLGKKKTLEQLIGCIVYILMVNLTAPIAASLNFQFESEMIMIIISSIAYGVFSGLIYRAGYSTGGSDFLAMMISEKFKIPMTKVSLVIQVLIILVSTFVFGIHKIMLSIFIIYVSNKITNSILFGVSTSKMVYIVSNESEDIENYIIHEINTGTTEIKVHSGLFEHKRPMLLCVVHNAQYTRFKNDVLSIDPDAFILSNKCFEVSGGKKLSILPF